MSFLFSFCFFHSLSPDSISPWKKHWHCRYLLTADPILMRFPRSISGSSSQTVSACTSFKLFYQKNIIVSDIKLSSRVCIYGSRNTVHSGFCDKDFTNSFSLYFYNTFYQKITSLLPFSNCLRVCAFMDRGTLFRMLSQRFSSEDCYRF